jgi:hypothetical protein
MKLTTMTQVTVDGVMQGNGAAMTAAVGQIDELLGRRARA